jgi:hypothetical protein
MGAVRKSGDTGLAFVVSWFGANKSVKPVFPEFLPIVTIYVATGLLVDITRVPHVEVI